MGCRKQGYCYGGRDEEAAVSAKDINEEIKIQLQIQICHLGWLIVLSGLIQYLFIIFYLLLFQFVII